MRFRNTTSIPDTLLREVIRFVQPSRVTRIKIEVRNATNVHGGASWTNARRVGLRFDLSNRYSRWIRPYQYGQLKGRRYWLASLVEHIVYIAAHELRHQWQDKARNRAGYVWGARGRHSEIDADSYAIKMLRQWRRERGFVKVDIPVPAAKPKQLTPQQRLEALAEPHGVQLSIDHLSGGIVYWVNAPESLCDADGEMENDPYRDEHYHHDYASAKEAIETYIAAAKVRLSAGQQQSERLHLTPTTNSATP